MAGKRELFKLVSIVLIVGIIGLALIRKYAPQDISMWGEWLVYGTALGVGGKVAEAMREFSIPLEELKIVQTMPIVFIPITT